MRQVGSTTSSSINIETVKGALTMESQENKMISQIKANRHAGGIGSSQSAPHTPVSSTPNDLSVNHISGNMASVPRLLSEPIVTKRSAPASRTQSLSPVFINKQTSSMSSNDTDSRIHFDKSNSPEPLNSVVQTHSRNLSSNSASNVVVPTVIVHSPKRSIGRSKESRFSLKSPLFKKESKEVPTI